MNLGIVILYYIVMQWGWVALDHREAHGQSLWRRIKIYPGAHTSHVTITAAVLSA